MKHLHHIKPKHRGGTDDDGVVEVSITCHAMFHWCEWKLHGHRGDWVAWQCLSGQITHAEANRLMKLGDNNPAKRPEVRVKISKAAKKQTNRAKTYDITLANGEVVRITNLKKWGRDNGYSYGGLKFLMNGSFKQLKGLQSIQPVSP